MAKQPALTEAIATLLRAASRTGQDSRSVQTVCSSCYDVENFWSILTANLGLLIYIPGFSDEGILLALAGGSNETFVSALGVLALAHAQS